LGKPKKTGFAGLRFAPVFALRAKTKPLQSLALLPLHNFAPQNYARPTAPAAASRRRTNHPRKKAFPLILGPLIDFFQFSRYFIN
jgi:hypothetical protein